MAGKFCAICIEPVKKTTAEEVHYEILLVVIFVTDPLRCAGVTNNERKRYLIREET